MTADNLLVAPVHIHIDNGGYTFEAFEGDADGHASMTVSESFYGYATSAISLHLMSADNLRQLASMLNQAADVLDKQVTA